MNHLQQPVSELSGVGTQTVRRLEKLGIYVIQDLIFHLPHRYENKTQVYPINSLVVGMTALVCAKVEFTEILPKGKRCLVSRVNDGTGFLFLKFFHYNAMQINALKPETWISCFGEIRHGFAGLEIVHPEYSIISNPENYVAESRLTPVYPLTEGLSQQTLRKIIKNALTEAVHLTELLPEWLLSRYAYPSLIDAIHSLHTPNDAPSIEALQALQLPALKRLAFEELLTHYLSLRFAKHKAKVWQAPVFVGAEKAVAQFLNALPFKLTTAQQRVIAEITKDCSSSQPMLRLVQGDVGSGKTVVCAVAALLALSAGYQVAVMAPTELLAEQHKRNFSVWFAHFATQVVFLTGQLKGKARASVLQSLAEGTAGIVIGTHALFQESVTFKRLGLIIIDEQHRFGVHQRLALREKAQHLGLRPHQLVMTATPIPRTLAMLQYADLDVSIIDELPPGRKPIVTSVIPAEKRDKVIERIESWIEKGRQAYWVCTLIEESEVLQCEAAEKTAERLMLSLPKVRIALIHGRMKANEKELIMQAFKHHELDLLVATTVIEVGVDVPNAGLMIIENPERLGLSQLHQLRGRVGRDENESFCLLMYQSPLPETARQRLGIIRDSQDGFFIAEQDLQIRGPGEVMGTRQTGAVHFKIADLSRDADLLERVQQDGEALFQNLPTIIEPLCDRWLTNVSDYTEV